SRRRGVHRSGRSHRRALLLRLMRPPGRTVPPPARPPRPSAAAPADLRPRPAGDPCEHCIDATGNPRTDRPDPRRRRTARQQAARAVHAVPDPVRRHRYRLDRHGLGRGGGHGPCSDESTVIKGLFTGEGMTWLTANLGINYIGFPPLVTVMPILLAIGIAQHSGLLAAAIRKLFGT